MKRVCFVLIMLIMLSSVYAQSTKVLKSISEKEFVTLVKEKTGLVLNYEKLKLKTYPDFDVKICADNLLLSDKKQKIVTVKNIDTKIFFPTLLFCFLHYLFSFVFCSIF